MVGLKGGSIALLYNFFQSISLKKACVLITFALSLPVLFKARRKSAFKSVSTLLKTAEQVKQKRGVPYAIRFLGSRSNSCKIYQQTQSATLSSSHNTFLYLIWHRVPWWVSLALLQKRTLGTSAWHELFSRTWRGDFGCRKGAESREKRNEKKGGKRKEKSYHRTEWSSTCYSKIKKLKSCTSPVSISYSNVPKLHQSTPLPYPNPWITSGAAVIIFVTHSDKPGE